VSRAASLGDSNSRMLMASFDGFLSYYPGRTENYHSQDSKPYHGHAPWFTSPCTRTDFLFDHLVGALLKQRRNVEATRPGRTDMLSA
jgi:hypothetical protein